MAEWKIRYENKGPVGVELEKTALAADVAADLLALVYQARADRDAEWLSALSADHAISGVTRRSLFIRIGLFAKEED